VRLSSIVRYSYSSLADEGERGEKEEQEEEGEQAGNENKKEGESRR
jgi:hypothetical protein